MAETKRVKVQEDATPDEVAERIGTLNGIMGGAQEVVVDEVQQPQFMGAPQQGPPMVEIRVSEDIEEMTYNSGEVRGRFTFKAGNRYKVPLPVALELEQLGKVWH